jgi:hypothetical protein
MSLESNVLRRAVLHSLVYAAGLVGSGCAVDAGDEASGVGHTQAAILTCPAGVCVQPGLANAPPPSPNTVVIPTSYISDQLNTVLQQTLIQVSQTTGDIMVFPDLVQSCRPNTGAVSACIANACGGLSGRAYVQCATACRQQAPKICTAVCSSTENMSFIRWGGLAKQGSLQNHPETCSPSTCPACPVPTNVPSLHDEQIFIPTFSKEIDPPLLDPIIVSCSINQWQFRIVSDDLNVTSASTGLTLQVPGSTGSPAIPCSNAPDISASGVGLELTFHPSMATGVLAVSAEGALDGTFSGGIIDVIVDVDADIKSEFHNQLNSVLNSGDKPAEYVDMFNGLIAQFLTDNQLPAVTTLESVSPTDQGLEVQYF